MTTCERLSERMPAVAAGGRWSDAEAAHLASCADCRAEWELVRATAGLGRHVTLRDGPAAIARGVLNRVRAAERGERSGRRRIAVLVGLAAAAAVVVGLWTTLRPRAPIAGPAPAPTIAQVDTAPDQGSSVELAELDRLDAAELEAVLETMDSPLTGPSTLDEPSGDLDHQELERVLRSWEG